MPLFLLQERDQAQVIERELGRQIALERLRQAIQKHLPEQAVWVYGSILAHSRFRPESDIDIALEKPSAQDSLYAIQSLLSEATGYEVDVCLLEETRLKEAIMSKGERWIESV